MVTRPIFPIICRLNEGSVSDIAAIEALSNRPPWPAELFLSEFIHSYSFTYGARWEGSLVGFLVAHYLFEEVHILNFGVRPDVRGRGVGRSLITGALRDFFKQGARWATLEVRKSNEPAKRLYESMGFFEVGIREKYYTDDQEDGLVLKLDIRDYLERTGGEN